jgi:hypothetical protein
MKGLGELRKSVMTQTPQIFENTGITVKRLLVARNDSIHEKLRCWMWNLPANESQYSPISTMLFLTTPLLENSELVSSQENLRTASTALMFFNPDDTSAPIALSILSLLSSIFLLSYIISPFPLVYLSNFSQKIQWLSSFWMHPPKLMLLPTSISLLLSVKIKPRNALPVKH